MPSTPASTEDILAATQSDRQIVLDVLPPEHFEARHIPGARNACVYEVTFSTRGPPGADRPP
jgi:rhodanese-related sulfurtransferase